MTVLRFFYRCSIPVNQKEMGEKRISGQIKGFSKLSRDQKLQWLSDSFFENGKEAIEDFNRFRLSDPKTQKVLDGFSENTLSNYFLPFGIAPNFLINDKVYAVPMVIEESSVVAAASSAAKFWLTRGGFRYEIEDVEKLGQVHFFWSGNPLQLKELFDRELCEILKEHIAPFISNMEKRGGGVRNIDLLDKTHELDNYYQLWLSFDTCDSMGANFINTVLEECLKKMKIHFAETDYLRNGPQPEFLMAILSNYTPDCLVRASVDCPVSELQDASLTLEASEFADRFYKAVRIAGFDKFRAVTHNKGIFNGVDAVVIASGNDFRAVEACGHAYASRTGTYRSLTFCEIVDDHFTFRLDIPLALGTVGGLTCLHPLAKRALELLGNPTAKELMGIAACTGLAQNFAAIRSLITTGIQYGHMKMHLDNILNHLNASDDEVGKVVTFFEGKTISFNSVRNYLEELRCRP